MTDIFMFCDKCKTSRKVKSLVLGAFKTIQFTCDECGFTYIYGDKE